MKSGRFWPWFLASILIFDVLIGVTMIIAANSDPSFAVEEGYYDKAVDWDDQIAERRASEGLGWTSDVRIIPVEGRKGRVVITMRDEAGIAVEDAAVHVEMFPNRYSKNRQNVKLESEMGGVHVGDFEIHSAGEWEVRIRATRGDDTYVASHRAFIPSPGKEG